MLNGIKLRDGKVSLDKKTTISDYLLRRGKKLTIAHIFSYRLVCLLLILLLIAPYSLIFAQSSARFVKITNLRLLPNPFSPYSVYNDGEKGLRISFQVEVPSNLTFVWLTTKIYNIRGELVRTLNEREPMYSNVDGGKYEGNGTEIIFWWDGKTDFHKYANNGRYILHLQVSDTEEEVRYDQKTASFVLVK